MRFRMLGPLRVRDGANWVPVPAEQQRVVLAVLLADPNRVADTPRLVDEVWGQRPPRTAVNTVQTYVMRLRRLLGDGVLVTRRHGYELVVGADDVDAAVFERLVASGRAALAGGQAEAAETRLSQALALWRGPALADVPQTLSLAAWVAQVEQARLAALEDRMEALLELGRHAQAADELYRLVGEHPLRERLWAHLMLALHRCGRRAESLEAYQRARQVLVAELGLEPGSPLRTLQATILADEQVQSVEVELVPPRMVPAQLPADVPYFTGRDEQLKQLDKLLPTGHDPAGTAVVISAIAGTAGVGKTALAVHWGHRVRDRFRDGQLYVNLRGFDPTGSVMDPTDAVRRFLDALAVPAEQVPADPGSQAALYRSLLAGKEMLVVLDNARDAAQIRPLLPGAAGCLALITSRDQLTGLVAADGAHPLTLDLLTGAEASDLLARRLGPDRVATEPGAVEHIIAACARLPLALAIVAARAATQPQLPLAALVDELHDRQNRLDALSTGDPATDVRAVFSWSYDTLTSEAARLFRLLGLHLGPDISAAATASLTGLPADQVRPLLAELTRANLIVEHMLTRYTLHDLLRTYATHVAHTTDSADELQAASARLLDHYLHTAHTAALLLAPARDPVRLTPPQPGVTPDCPTDHHQALAWFSLEHATLLAAIDHAVATGLDTYTWQLAWTLNDFLHWRGHWQDWIVTGRAAVDAATRLADPTVQAHAHRNLALAYTRLGHFDDAHTHLRHALDLAAQTGDEAGQANAHFNLAWVCERQGRYTSAITHARQALDLYRAADHRPGQGDALNAIGWFHALLGDHRQALAYCQQGLTLHQEVDDRFGQANTCDSLGYAHHHLGQHTQAIACYQNAIDLFRDLGDRYNEATSLTHLGDTHHTAGDRDAAGNAWQQALTILDELDHPDSDQVRSKLAGLTSNAPRTVNPE